MLRINLNADDLGRVRFAEGPAPVLETALMLFELRSRPRTFAPESHRGRDDWRTRVRTHFPEASRPLLNLVSSRDHVLLLDVLTPDAEEAFRLALDTPNDVHEMNLETIEQHMPGLAARWLLRYYENDRRVLEPLDGALRAFHKEHLAPYWSPITERFDDDVDYRTALMRDQGIAAMIESLHPALHLDGSILYSPYPGDREADLSGRGVILMPSTFWTGRPLLTWDPQQPSRNVLIYPAKPPGRRPGIDSPSHNGTRGPASGAAGPPTALAKLMGPTRAALLSSLRRPATTTGVARALGISPASASAHAAALRDAGLITTHRTGKSVEHRLTPLGRNLLSHAMHSRDAAAGHGH